MSKTRASGFIPGSKLLETDGSTRAGLRSRGFICFSVFGTHDRICIIILREIKTIIIIIVIIIIIIIIIAIQLMRRVSSILWTVIYNCRVLLKVKTTRPFTEIFILMPNWYSMNVFSWLDVQNAMKCVKVRLLTVKKPAYSPKIYLWIHI